MTDLKDWPTPFPTLVEILVVTDGASALTILQALVALVVASARSLGLAGTPEVLPIQVTSVKPGLALKKLAIALLSEAATGPRSPLKPAKRLETWKLFPAEVKVPSLGSEQTRSEAW